MKLFNSCGSCGEGGEEEKPPEEGGGGEEPAPEEGGEGEETLTE